MLRWLYSKVKSLLNGGTQRISSLNQRVTDLYTRYTQLRQIDDLNEGIILGREALSLCPPGHPHRLTSLNNLEGHLFFRYNQLGVIDDLNEAIALGREVLSLIPHKHTIRSSSLNNLAIHLSSRYKQLGRIDDLNEAVVLAREALSLCPPGHPHRSTSLSNLALHLSSRHNQLGGIDDLNEAIVLDQESLSLRPFGHPHRSKAVNNLVVHLSSRYKQLGGIVDLNDVIVLDRESLSLLPPGHPDRSTSLSNLARHLSSRYKQLGWIDDLNEAIILDQESLSLRPLGHPDRSTSLSNLALHLSLRYTRLGGIDDINEAVVLDRESLSLCPPGHPHHSTSLSNLAAQLFSRYKQLGETDDLNEAIFLGRESFSLLPPGHPDRSASLSNLALHLFDRYTQLGGIDDLNEAIILGRESLSLRPPGHPHRSTSLRNLALHLSFRYTEREGIDDLNEAIKDKEELFGLYTELDHVSQTVSLDELSAAREWTRVAEKFTHPTTLLAYETSLRFLVQHLAVLPSLPKHLDLLKSLSSSLAVDAFSACLRNQSPIKAVELLEQGRAIFWSQLTGLHSPLHDVTALGPQGDALVDEFTRLTSLIRNTQDLDDSGQHDQVRYLNLELGKVVSKIRELPGLSRFLLPSPFSDLQWAAKEGPIIIMNASEYGCDALVVFSGKDPIHIPLSVTKGDVRALTLRLSVLRNSAKTMKTEKTETGLENFLRELWDTLVSQIVDVLQTTCPRNSRIWWCPTAEFSLLPLHAANPYRQGQNGIPDLYVSSYTATLTALIRARRAGLLDSPHEKPRLVTIGQAAVKGINELSAVGAELDKIGQLIDGLATVTRIEGEESRISTFADELGKNDWVHFACYGIPNQEKPLESAFALCDRGSRIQQIRQCDFQNPEFAFLPACHTTVGDQESPDEVIHLAAAMQFAGFRSVIGMMWTGDDSQTYRVISKFYELMINENNRLDYTRAARALRFTIQKLDISMDQRVLYIHLGV